jgi:hypothetical protein
MFPYTNTTYIGSYHGSLLLWILTRIYPRGTNAMGTGRRTYVNRPITNFKKGHKHTKIRLYLLTQDYRFYNFSLLRQGNDQFCEQRYSFRSEISVNDLVQTLY